jgi:predicted anti-sigma-YlaC factor YlaD
MTREEYLEFCSVCKNRTFNPKQGIICSLTNEVASFAGNCPDYLEDEREVVIESQKVESREQETKKGINKGRYALFFVALLYIIIGYIEGYTMDGHDPIFGIIDWSIAAVFVGLGIWSYWKASLALIIGLGFYIAILLLLVALEPSTILQGIIWKVIVITALVQGIRTARAEEAKHKEMAVDLLDQF